MRTWIDMCPREVNVQMVELRVIVEEDSQLVGGSREERGAVREHRAGPGGAASQGSMAPGALYMRDSGTLSSDTIIKPARTCTATAFYH